MIHPNRPSNVYPVRKNHKLELSYFARTCLGIEVIIPSKNCQKPSHINNTITGNFDMWLNDYLLDHDYTNGNCQLDILQKKELETKNKIIFEISQKLFSHLSIEKLELILKQSHL